MVLTAKCSAGGIAPCLVPDDSIGSTATRFGGHPEEVNKELDLGKLISWDVSSWGNEPNRLCRGETTEFGTGFVLESEKLCCMDEMVWNEGD